jgi:polyisoprenoid-binding protein YceI
MTSTMKNPNIWRAVAIANFVGVVSLGCNNDFDDKPKASVNPTPSIGAASADLIKKSAPDVAASPAYAQLSGVWPLDESQSEVGFEGAKVTGKHVGSFKKVDGKLSLSSGKVNALNITIDTASVESDDEKLTGHLKSADFFDVEKFPQSTFVSTNVVEKAANGATHEVTGNLTLHGVTKSVTFPVSVQADTTSAKGTAEFTINRKDFNIVYPGKSDDLIKDDVLLKLKLTFKPTGAGAETVAPAAGVDGKPVAETAGSAAAGSGAAATGAAATGAAASAAASAGVSADIGSKVKEAAAKANDAIKDVAKAAENATGSEVDKAAAALKAASEKAKKEADKLSKPAASK